MSFYCRRNPEEQVSHDWVTASNPVDDGFIALNPGSVVITPGALQLDSKDRLEALQRHFKGDWGNVGPEDWRANDNALKGRERLHSIYESEGVVFWIITEGDRSVTTILLPDEY